MKIAYIAGPYRAKNGRTILDNIRAAEQVALEYWKKGYAVICPHLNTAFFDGHCPDSTWLDGDLKILSRCDVIVMMPTYMESSGAIAELQLAGDLGIEIIYHSSDGDTGVDSSAKKVQNNHAAQK